MSELIPGATVGVVGGGQLGRMLAEAASPLGVEVLVLDPTPECPASPPATDQIVADFDDESAIRDLAARVDVLTLEIELADPEGLREASAETGTPVHPAPADLETTRDKLAEARSLADAGIPVADFRRVDEDDDLAAAFDVLGTPLMLKARHGGYDGRGNAVVDTISEATTYFGTLDDLVAEQLVDFERELSVIGVRGHDAIATYPVAENRHEAEILRETLVPARTDDAVHDRAEAVARDVIAQMDGRGVFGIELFETTDGEILVNEIAPRPHNSGHYTIEGTVTSQFEQHVRAILGHPLGETALRAPTAMVNLLGTGEENRSATLSGVEDALAMANAHFHWYGKRDVRPLRKMGHVTATGSGLATARSTANAARDAIDFE
ncbi:5-(carboxyamino)imidazole ribonucleotide synthase [Halanaeroarchaeum sulfurireducens]|uniref:N5-carboxyaminoimidazole ribonucleotide synthase n=1 Tax=Halanaeroarchaeum sulfurireducens TaxID=1604004 RepID=A0A0F7PDK5_9EURY|nr:5-(carboxyamino)imidazole ribonucleotide synthase [Halanaeroarchaeum sulfurireducens]AKH97724.1 phosphoribosylaminoimidazole carboxylase, ATPase subunit [Halanaeroarchaeum sulfurireducens]ALG82119.1 phosphoribosylaminoimidazole carboxylase, ATPasesubunit [Halanaeroarchaeum sulfurireducens]